MVVFRADEVGQLVRLYADDDPICDLSHSTIVSPTRSLGSRKEDERDEAGEWGEDREGGTNPGISSPFAAEQVYVDPGSLSTYTHGVASATSSRFPHVSGVQG